jgi:hypothetical protein
MPRSKGLQGAKLLLLWAYWGNCPRFSGAQESSDACTLCADGSQPSIPNGRVVLLDGDEWKCSDLHQILDLLGVKSGEEECTTLQFRGFVNCGCPTFSNEAYCSLCPGGLVDIPMPNTTIPGYDLTCGDILFAKRNDQSAAVSCDAMGRFTRLCRCPDQCSLCRYSDEIPAHPDRNIPYLSQNDNHVTCADQEAAARLLPRNEHCEVLRQAPVPVNVEGYCGCPLTSPTKACSLCPEGEAIQNPELVLPNVGGLNCLELEEYLSFVTDASACRAIATKAEACCRTLDPCPVCPDGSHGLGSGKVYQPFSLGCDLIGQATHYGFPLTCAAAQERFPFFCRCENATPQCSICPVSQVPPDPNRFIPLLNLTCGEANDFVSLRTGSECQATIATFALDVAAFCGCAQDASLLGRCAFCPEGQDLISVEQDAALGEGETLPETIFGSPNSRATLVPLAAATHCQELQHFAAYISRADLCRAAQQSSPDCCRPVVSTEVPTASTGAPTFRPTIDPSPPTLPGINGTWDSDTNNLTDFGNATIINETIAPLIPPESAPDGPDQESKATTFYPMISMLCFTAIGAGMLFL